MSESAKAIEPIAAEALKAYIRLNRRSLAADGELLALLIPERFRDGEAHDLQRFVIEKLLAENAALKAKLDAVERAVLAWRNAPKI
jgi:hypothetical protein